MRRLWSLLVAGCALAVAPAAVQAQDGSDYPNRPVTLVVAFSPGGSTDNLARTIVEDLSAQLGQPVVVENRPGAGGYVAWRSMQAAEPDGYTILLAENALAIGKALRPDEPLDPREAFEPVARIGAAPMALIVNADLGPSTFQEFLDFDKNGEGVTFSSSGVGSVSHLTFEALSAEAGLNSQHVPFKGGGEANAAVSGGHVNAMMQSIGSSRQMQSSGSVKVLAVTAPERVAAFPDTPTLNELGIKANAELRFWWGLFVPAGTPDPVKQKLQDAVQAMLDTPKLKEHLAGIEVAPEFAPGPDMGKLLDSEISSWASYIQARGITTE